MKVGIPRALHTYYFFTMWQYFLSELGADVVLSPPSNKRIFEQGIALSVADICAPIKLLFGHIASLVEKVDAVFVPRVVSVHPKRFFCPKFIALPDMVKAVFPGLKVLSADLNAKEGWRAAKASFCKLGEECGAKTSQASAIFEEAVSRQFEFGEAVRDIRLFDLLEKKNPTWKDFSGKCEASFSRGFSIMKSTNEDVTPIAEEKLPNEDVTPIALLGYPYIIHDGLVSLNIKEWFKRNSMEIVTYEMIPKDALDAVDMGLSRDVYWEASKNIIQAAIWCLGQENIAGVIFITSFGCGPGSMKKEIIERRARRARGKPFMSLVVDEHTSSGGFVTRLEAFVDMMEFGKSRFSSMRDSPRSG